MASLLDKSYETTLAGAEAVYGVYHPVLAILYAEWGNILAMSPSPEDGGVQRITRSVRILRIAEEKFHGAFGGDGGIEGRAVRDTRKKVEYELGMLRVDRG